MQIVIALCGAKGSGKSTFARILRERYPFVAELALANKLKDACAEALDIPREAFDNPEEKERYLGALAGGPDWPPVCLNRHMIASIIDAFGFSPTDALVDLHVGKVLYTPRQAAQYVGTEVLRAVDPFVHCKGLMLDAPKDGPFVVTDVRFPNEYEFFSRFGTGFFPTYVKNVRAETEAAKDPHPSEKYLKDVAAGCRTIDNDGSLAEFESKVINYVDGIFSQFGMQQLTAVGGGK